MSSVRVTSFSAPDEVRVIADKCTAQIVSFDGSSVGRVVFEPGWRWSIHNKPTAGTDSCQGRHLGFVVSGRMGFRLDDGTTVDIGPGDVFDVPSGHDAWVVGDEPCVFVDWGLR